MKPGFPAHRRSGSHFAGCCLVWLLGGSLATPALAQLTWSGNLISNAGAEADSGSSSAATVFPSGWTVDGTLTAFRYGGGSYADLAVGRDPLPAGHGVNFFAGGSGGLVDGSTVYSTASQTISLAPYASGINAGVGQYNLSGWLGGWSSQSDNATVTATFYNGIGQTIGSATIGPVTVLDRNDVTGLFYRQVAGSIPVGSLSALVQITMARNLNVGSYNDGYADELSLLVGVPEPFGATLAGLGLVGFVACRSWSRRRP